MKLVPGKTFVDVLGQIRCNVIPTDTGANVKELRKTWARDVLVEVGPAITSIYEFGEALRSTLSNSATVPCVEPKATAELRYLDELTTREEVTTAVHVVVENVAEAKVFVSKANSRGHLNCGRR